MRSQVEALRDVLVRQNWTISTAESCTGGMCAAALVDLPGSSSWFPGSVIAYDNSIKKSLLNISEPMLLEHGAVSEPVAIAMARGVRKLCGTTVSCSTTGVAGPGGGTFEKPVGTVWIGIATPDGCKAKRLQLNGDRNAIREQTVQDCFNFLLENIKA